MPDGYGRFSMGDGLAIANTVNTFMDRAEYQRDKEAEKLKTEQIYQAADALKNGGDISSFGPEVRFEAAKIKFGDEVAGYDATIKQHLASDAGRQSIMSEYELKKTQAGELFQRYQAYRRQGNDEEARKIAVQFNNSLADNGLFVQPNGKGQIDVTKWDHSKETVDDLSIEDYDNLFAGYMNLGDDELLKRHMGGIQLRQKANQEILSKAEPMFNDAGDVIYRVPAGTWGKDGQPMGAFYIRSLSDLAPIPEEKVKGYHGVETLKGSQEIKKGGLDIKNKKIKNQKDRIVSPNNMVTSGDGSQQGPAMMNEQGTGLSIAPVEGGLKKTADAPSVSDQNALKDQEVDDLKAVLMPFNEKGGTVIDFQTGELTQSGKNALDSAMKIIEKHQNKEQLTAAEQKKVQHAYRAWKMYESISQSRANAGASGGSWRDYQ